MYKPSPQTEYQKKYQKAEEYIIKRFPKEFAINKVANKSSQWLWLKRPVSYKYNKRKIIIHHTAESNKDKNITTISWEMQALQDIYKFHTFSRGWWDVGYNYIIGPLGTIYDGRYGWSDAVGAHASRNNTESIGIALLGNFDIENPTEAQIASLKKLLVALWQKYKINPQDDVIYHTFDTKIDSPYIRNFTLDSIIGHSDVGSTACPGENLYALLPDLKRSVAQQLGYIKTVSPNTDIKPSVISPTPPVLIRSKKKIYINNVFDTLKQ